MSTVISDVRQEVAPRIFHPQDAAYRLYRWDRIQENLKLDERTLDQKVKMMWGNRPKVEREQEESDRGMIKSIMTDMYSAPYVPANVKSILDSTGSGTSGGSVMIRQDLEPILYALTPYSAL
jgi:hypothetical protein